MTVLPDFW